MGGPNITQKEFINRSNKIHQGKYTYENVVYQGFLIKVNITCKIHNQFFQTPNNHLSGRGCQKCGINSRVDKQRSTTKLFVLKAIEVHGDKFNYSKVNYKNSISKVRIICKKCNKEFLQQANSHLMGYGCKNCANKELGNKHRKTMEKFISEAEKIHGCHKYDYSKIEYETYNLSKVLIRCVKHDIWFSQVPQSHILGKHACKKCKVKSKGESYIASLLEKNNVYYEREVQFSDCILKNSKKHLRFDFYLPKENILIEYDGIQHFKLAKTWYKDPKAGLEKIKDSDKFKTNWAKNNGYNLLRIPYTEFKNIDKILSLELGEVYGRA